MPWGALQQAIDNIEVDAAVGRQVSEGIIILRGRRDAGMLGEVVIVHLGNNGTFYGKQFDEMMQVLAETPQVIFVDLKVPRQWEDGNNRVLTEGVPRYANARLVDWRDASVSSSGLFWGDEHHLRPQGAQAYASSHSAIDRPLQFRALLPHPPPRLRRHPQPFRFRHRHQHQLPTLRAFQRSSRRLRVL